MFKPLLTVALLACVSLPAYAQQYRAEECWNPNAGHFEGVRPGETQNDLDFRRCRPTGDYRPSRGAPRECWNPRARHFEGVREGERQDDLDMSRCHVVLEQGYDRGRRDNIPRECWNPRAGHFEGVREGERQDDLDFSRCRRR
ncbi:MAG: hypothetical protein ABI854_11480 [Betaproteobacteria bacterium]